jgi:hypothetical protein
MRGVVAAVLGALVLAGAASAGGSIRAFVLLPAQGRLAIADADGSIIRMVAVPPGAGPVAAGIDGREVLVANTRRGLVTELDGLSGRRLHVFARLDHPIALVMVPRPSVGLVQPRYAVAADARGYVDVLDLRSGRTVRRIHVMRPVALALSEPYLWVASAGRQRLTQLNVTDVPHMRVIAHPDVQVPAVALAPDPVDGVDAISRHGTLVRLGGVATKGVVVARLGGVTTALLAGYQQTVWVERGGRLLGVQVQTGRVAHSMALAGGSRLAIVGGWLAVGHGRSVGLVELGGTTRGPTISLPAPVGAFSFAVV